MPQFFSSLLSPARRRACIEQIQSVMHVSERRACAALGQHRSTQRKVPRGREDEERLTADTIALARQYGRYGYRKIAGLLEQAGWLVNDKRVERIWRREGLKVPHKQPKRGRLWLSDGSCIRLRPEHRNHVWSYDFVEDRTHDGRKYRMLNVIDEFTHECLAIRVARKLKAIDVIDVLSDLFILRGVPGHIRSDNGPEFVAKAVQEWITAFRAERENLAGDGKGKGTSGSNPEAESTDTPARLGADARGAKGAGHQRWARANWQQEELQFSTEGGSLRSVARAG